jgi:nucleoside-diphosphate-sugar epimerase
MLNLPYKQTEQELQQHYYNAPVLVTGGAGFIGSHLVDRLVSLGARVTVIDNLSSGSLENLTTSRNAITFIEASITDATACINAMPENAYVFHLAALVSVPDSINHPIECHTVNVTGTLNILEAARMRHAQCVVLSSSSAVYGNLAGIAHEQLMCAPISPYGASKYIDEVYCRTYSTSYHVPTICLRYFNVHGKRQNPYGPYAGVVAKFTDSMTKNGPITVYGDGTQSRDFVPVAHVVEANIRLALLNNALLDGRPVNIATGNSITILELLEHLAQEFPGYSGTITFVPERAGDIRHSQADCKQLWELI